MSKQIRPVSGIILILAVLALAGWYLYAPALQAPFVFDDIDHIVNNPGIRLTAITPDSLAGMLKNQPGNRPLTYATFALNYYFGRYDVRGYHVVNLASHIITALLVFLIARLTLGLCGAKSARTPFLAAVLWLVNPVHTQSVTYIVQRMNALSTLFVLLALTCYIQARRHMRLSGKTGRMPIFLLAGAGISGLFGLISKETAAILPIILLLYEWFFFQNLDRAWLKKQLAWISVAVVILIVITFVYTAGNPARTVTGMYEGLDFTPGQRLLTQPQVILYYLTLLFFPHPARLNLDYNFPPAISPLSPATTLPAILALLALTAVAVYTAKKHRLLSFAILWFLATLAIESSVIGLALIFEHRTYLPSVFPAIAVICLLERRIKPPPALILAVGALIAVCGVWTYQRNLVWSDTLAFWQDTVRKSPDKALSCNNLGLAYKNIGDLDKALFFSKKALALREARFGESHPAVAESLSNIGLVYYRQGDYDRALAYHLHALTIRQSVFGDQDHQLFETYNNIGLAYDGKGDFDMAVNYYRRALDIERTVPGTENLHTASIYNNLGSAWYNKGDFDQALTSYRKALTIRTEFLGDRHPQIAECYNNIGLTQGSRGDYRAAIHCYQQALDIELAVLGINHPYTAATYFNLGLTSYARGDYRNAVFYMRKVLTLYSESLGRHHPYIETAQSILNEALLNTRDMPSTGNNLEGAEGSWIKQKDQRSTKQIKALTKTLATTP